MLLYSLEQQNITVNDSWYAEDNGIYHSYFLEFDRSLPEEYQWSKQTIGHMTSNNLIDWNYEGTVIDSTSAPWLDMGVATGSIVKYNDLWYMIFTAKPQDPNKRGLAIAVSHDLMKWEIVGDGPVIPCNHRYEVNYNGGDTLTVTKDGLTTYLTVDGQNQYNEETNGKVETGYYYVTKIQGDLLHNFDAPSTRALLYAYWANEYSATISNTASYWYDVDNENSTLYGAYAFSSGVKVDSEDIYSTTLKIADKVGYEYAFINSEQGITTGLSFLHNSDWKSSNRISCNAGEYYVFSYGQYLSGWIISILVSDGEEETKLWYNGSSWVATETIWDTDDIDDKTMDQLAHDVDELLLDYESFTQLTLVPQWKNVKVKVLLHQDYRKGVNDVLASSITFANPNKYTFANIAKLDTAKSIMAYYYGESENNLISDAAIWNYRNIPYSVFETYSRTGSEIGSGTYTITLKPVYVDDIFRVELIEARMTRPNEYLLSNCDYVFNNNVGLYAEKIRLSYKDKVDANYNFTAYNNEALVDTYITNTLSVCLNSYKAGIQLDNPECFDIFKKVYYIADDVALHSADVENDTLFVTDAVLEPPKFYIYLANNQYTGMMPVFKSTFYSLMFWQNTDRNKSNGSKYNIYPTAEFTAEDFDETMQNQYIIHKDGDNLSYIWNYEDGYDSSSKEVTLTPYYLRKVYTLDIETISKNTGNVERRGYVRVKSEDTVWQEGQDPAENGSLDCIFIYNYDTGTMEIYNWSDGMNLTTCTDYINGTNKVSGFQIFAGCTVTLTVYDQSKDIVAMNTANYDDMIGFKFSKELSQAPKELFEEAVDGNDYQYKMTAEEIEGKHFKNHEAFEIDVCFERIVYSLTAEIDKVKAGGFAIQQNGGTKQYKTRTTINTVAVQNSYLIDYYAYAGFKLQNNAFIYYNGASEGVALLTYNEGEAIVNDRSAQSYRMTKRYYGNNTLDGTWLREYFYSAYTDYDVENTTLGLITINTDAIVFDYAVKVRDESDVSLRENAYILEVPDDYKTTFSLDRDSGKGLTPEMSTYVTDENLGFYYYNSLSDVDYALISSKLHYPANPTANDDCLFATYSFLLTEQPINQYEIMSTHIGRMVENFEEGKIISFDDRQLYFVLEVRKLFTVQMAVEVSEHDTNSTTRTTKLQNGNNNEVEIIINGTATISNVEGKDYYLNSNNTINVTAYSYFGLNNVLTSEFDTKRYSSVSYLRKFTDGVDEYESNESDGAFVTEQNCEVYIKYIPSNLKVEFEYYLEGTFLDSPDDVALYLNDNNIHKPNDENTYYIGDTVSYMVERVNQDYNLKVTINGTVMGTTTLTESIIKCLEENGNLYTVGDRDFDIGVIKIVVDILEKSKSPITVSYQLLSVTQRFADDDYGTFDLFENDTEILSDVNSASTPIIEGRDVFVKLQLPLGYEYVGIKYNYNDYQVVEPDVDGKIKLVGDYDPLTNYGSYKIIIKKLPITAVLDASNVNALSRYKMNGQSMLENLYVGSIINFSSDPAQQERLDYFYYKTLGDDVVIDGMSIKITSEMLGQVGSTYLNFGVAVINRYKLDLVVKGRDYLAEEYPQVENITANNNYKFTRSWDAANKILTLTGEYVDVNTELKVNILSLVTGKYNISFNGNVSDTVSEQLAPLTEDTSYQIIVEPKTYEILRAENLYSNLSQVLDPDNNPLDVIDEVNHVNDIQSVTPKYNQQITISFARTTLDRELATLYISGNDETDTFVVKFNGQIFEAYKVLEDDQLEFIDNFESYGYKIKVLENTRVEMTYTTYNTINLRFDYKLYKYITS